MEKVFKFNVTGKRDGDSIDISLDIDLKSSSIEAFCFLTAIRDKLDPLISEARNQVISKHGGEKCIQ